MPHLSPELTTLFEAGLIKLGIAPLTPRQVNAFAAYLDLLLEWNQKFNLTAITKPSDVIIKHFIDSLAIVPVLPVNAKVLDVGAGAGFPTVCACLVRPDLNATLLEPTQKKANFLLVLREALELSYTVSIDRLVDHRQGNYDVVVSRATMPAQKWLLRAPAQARVGGIIITMLARLPEDLRIPSNLAKRALTPYPLPDGSPRQLLICERLR